MGHPRGRADVPGEGKGHRRVCAHPHGLLRFLPAAGKAGEEARLRSPLHDQVHGFWADVRNGKIGRSEEKDRCLWADLLIQSGWEKRKLKRRKSAGDKTRILRLDYRT